MNDATPSDTHRFVLSGVKGYITAVAKEGKVTDVFVEVDKEGGDLGGWVRAWAVLVSKVLQAGVSLEYIIRQFKGWSFGKGGVTANPEIPIAKSIPDYIVRWLEIKYKKGAAE